MLYHLKKLRMERNITQKMLADAIGVSQQSINKYENHNIEPDIETLVRLANYFDTSVDYLVGHWEERERPGGTKLTVSELDLLDSFDRLNSTQKECILMLLRTFLGDR